jgi:hypothetical protein
MPDQSVGDTFTLSDGSIINNSLHTPLFTDSLSLLDAILLAVPTQEILYDTLALSDNVRFSTSGLGLTLRDNFNLSDSVRTSRTQNTPLSDTISISDTLSVTLNSTLGILTSLVFGALDTIFISDTLSVTLAGGTYDVISFSDALLVGLALGVSDTLSLSDSITNLLIPIPLTNLRSDTLYLSDSISYVISNSLIVLSDSIIFSDRINVLLNSAGNSYLRRYLNDVIN